MSPAEVLQFVQDLGGRVEASGDKLKVFLPPDADTSILEEIKLHKSALLDSFKPPHVRNPLYRFIGKPVMTTKGRGKLMQVFGLRVAVVFEGSDKVAFFKPDEISSDQN